MTTTDPKVKAIRAARAYAGLKQEDLAAALDMSVVTYKRIESGKREPSAVELERIAELTGWPVELFYRDVAAAAPGAEKEELEGLRDSIQGLVHRLEDIEYRMRQTTDESARLANHG